MPQDTNNEKDPASASPADVGYTASDSNPDGTLYFPVFEKEGDRLIITHFGQETREEAEADGWKRTPFMPWDESVVLTDEIYVAPPDDQAPCVIWRSGPLSITILSGPTFDRSYAVGSAV